MSTLNKTYPSVAVRVALLKKLKTQIKKQEKEICEALAKDLGKPTFESMLTETQFVLAELRHTIKHLRGWAVPKRIPGSMLNFPAKEYIYQHPYGRVLIFAPWNYPFQLTLAPLIGAVAAGNSVVLKPSEMAPNTGAVIKDILTKVFDIKFVTVIEGGPLLAKELLKQQWDYIFYTGSTAIGKEIYQAAAKNLTPVTLELGGKSPCIVHESASLKVAAKRIAWGKFVNTGQTCVAPDFVLVHESVKQQFTQYLISAIKDLYGENPEENTDYGKIINKKHFQRLIGYLEGTKISHGGTSNETSLYIAPTVVDNPSLQSAVMSEEIFGPILPIISYTYEKDLDTILKKYEHSLALYVFANNKEFTNAIIENYAFGGGCINDTLVHLVNNQLPFGGIGNSGIGKYHGKYSFDTFSHSKAIVKRSKLENPLRYAPYKKKTKLIKLLYRFIN
ncbi:aldehyde dehydrogenase [Neptunitalea lumnitzerae]|uniref:Aldehyde dehydrogenase n=1 Tax=Neptunitalea lumnitzerae TaxID=2965509 RepID=A0ABQ5MK83_9FLAO|nr:aldehyde dehydrogenase [Neptunitalea sp. Y10]GLB49788.1 aldehyde dehydrogenase [Neptunitalea sp. Y10]